MTGDVVAQVAAFLEERAKALVDSGVRPSRVVLDPGIGFGKTVAQNFALLRHQAALADLGYPVLAGWSRKSSLGAVIEQVEAQHRVSASVAAALMAVERGARIVRVHDVRETADALKVWAAVHEGERQPAMHT